MDDQQPTDCRHERRTTARVQGDAIEHLRVLVAANLVLSDNGERKLLIGEITRAEAVVQALATLLGCSSNVGVTNFGYLDSLENWLASLSRIGREGEALVFTLDDLAFCHLRAANVCVVDWGSGATEAFLFLERVLTAFLDKSEITKTKSLVSASHDY